MSASSGAEVLIVGGGLAGLTLANYLRRTDLGVTVVERADEWRAGGYGIGLWGDGLAVLDDLGLLDRVRERGTDPATVEVRAGGDRLARASLPPGRTLLLAVHRADLHAALRDPVPDDRVRLGTEPERIDERGDGVAVAFEDGDTERFDVVVGADGVGSTVREACFDGWTLEERDTYVWSLWGPGDIGLDAEMVSVWGPRSEAFVASVGDRVGLNLAARRAAPPDGPARDSLRAHAEAVGWTLPALLDETDGEPFLDRVREVSCPRWHADRVALVGDAAHAVHPISGMGASLALQDARVLAQELATGDAGSPSRALARYEERRRPAARRTRRAARVESGVAFLESRSLRAVRNGLVEHTPLLRWFVERRSS